MVIDFYTRKEIKTNKTPNPDKVKMVKNKYYNRIKEVAEIIKQKRNLQALYRRNELVVINGYRD